MINGYRTFLSDHFAREQSRYEALAERGQNPEILVIGCCDSRVSPEVISDASPGELFIVCNVANLATFRSRAAVLEFLYARHRSPSLAA